MFGGSARVTPITSAGELETSPAPTSATSPHTRESSRLKHSEARNFSSPKQIIITSEQSEDHANVMICASPECSDDESSSNESSSANTNISNNCGLQHQQHLVVQIPPASMHFSNKEASDFDLDLDGKIKMESAIEIIENQREINDIFSGGTPLQEPVMIQDQPAGEEFKLNPKDKLSAGSAEPQTFSKQSFSAQFSLFRYMLLLAGLNQGSSKLYCYWLRFVTYTCTVICFLNLIFSTASYRNPLFDLGNVLLHIIVVVSYEYFLKFCNSQHWRTMIAIVIRVQSARFSKNIRYLGYFGFIMIAGAVITIVLGWEYPIFNAVHSELTGHNHTSANSKAAASYLILHGVFMLVIVAPWTAVCITCVCLFKMVILAHEADIEGHFVYVKNLLLNSVDKKIQPRGTPNMLSRETSKIGADFQNRLDESHVLTQHNVNTVNNHSGGGQNQSTNNPNQGNLSNYPPSYPPHGHQRSIFSTSEDKPIRRLNIRTKSSSFNDGTHKEKPAHEPTKPAAFKNSIIERLRQSNTPKKGSFAFPPTTPGAATPLLGPELNLSDVIQLRYRSIVSHHHGLRGRLQTTCEYFNWIFCAYILLAFLLMFTAINDFNNMIVGYPFSSDGPSPEDPRSNSLQLFPRIVQDAFFLGLGACAVWGSFFVTCNLSSSWQVFVSRMNDLPLLFPGSATSTVPFHPSTLAALITYYNNSNTTYTNFGVPINFSLFAKICLLATAAIILDLILVNKGS
jgi:hypothetical protein